MVREIDRRPYVSSRALCRGWGGGVHKLCKCRACTVQYSTDGTVSLVGKMELNFHCRIYNPPHPSRDTQWVDMPWEIL